MAAAVEQVGLEQELALPLPQELLIQLLWVLAVLGHRTEETMLEQAAIILFFPR